MVAGQSGRVEVTLKEKPAPPPTPEPVDVTRVYPNEAGQVDTLARKLSGSSPSYPSGRAPRLKSGQRVSVLVRYVVTETGEVGDVTVVEVDEGRIDKSREAITRSLDRGVRGGQPERLTVLADGLVKLKVDII